MSCQQLEDSLTPFGELTESLESLCGSSTRVQSCDLFYDLYQIPASQKEGRRSNAYFAVRENTLPQRRGTVGTARLMEAGSPEEAIDSLGRATYNLEDSAKGADIGISTGIVFGSVFAAAFILPNSVVAATIFGTMAAVSTLGWGIHHYLRFIDRRRTRQAVAGVLEYT